MDDAIRELVSGLPLSLRGWIVVVSIAPVITAIVVKILRSDEFEFWGFKWRRNRELRDLLRQTQREVARLGGLIPLLNFLNGELAGLMADIIFEPRAVPGRRLAYIYQAVLAGVVQILNAEGYHRAAILFPEREGQDTVLKVSWTLHYSTDAQANLRFGMESIPGRVFRTGEYYYCEDTKTDKNYVENPNSTHTYRSFVCIPIRYSSKGTLGVLQVDAVEPNAFTKDDINTLFAFAKYIAALRLVEFMLNSALVEVVPGEDPHGTAD